MNGHPSGKNLRVTDLHSPPEKNEKIILNYRPMSNKLMKESLTFSVDKQSQESPGDQQLQCLDKTTNDSSEEKVEKDEKKVHLTEDGVHKLSEKRNQINNDYEFAVDLDDSQIIDEDGMDIDSDLSKDMENLFEQKMDCDQETNQIDSDHQLALSLQEDMYSLPTGPKKTSGIHDSANERSINLIREYMGDLS